MFRYTSGSWQSITYLEVETMAEKTIAVYVRVSSNRQDHRSQLADLKAWEAGQSKPVKWYRDKQSGRTMDREGWNRLEKDIAAGKVNRIVVWRLDRIGRTAAGLTALFEDLQQRRVGLLSLREGLDLSTPAGRLMAHVVASVAQYENEVKSERVRAGQAAAKAAGKTWGGRKPGTRIKVTREKERTVKTLHGKSESIAAIARAVGLSRPTIYKIIE
jgi:DNA invertase Pin-like site-specific DNA recombinase